MVNRTSRKNTPEIQGGMTSIPMDPAGMLASEKLDGCRCIYDGNGNFLSRNGHAFKCPAWFKMGMPSVRLDGEFYAGRGGFDHLVSEIQRKKSDWRGITFQVFDLAVLRVPIEARHAALGRLRLPPHVQLVPHRVCASMTDLDAMEREIVTGGGEGVCLRDAGSFYSPGGLVKVKRLFPDLNRSILD